MVDLFFFFEFWCGFRFFYKTVWGWDGLGIKLSCNIRLGCGFVFSRSEMSLGFEDLLVLGLFRIGGESFIEKGFCLVRE